MRTAKFSPSRWPWVLLACIAVLFTSCRGQAAPAATAAVKGASTIPVVSSPMPAGPTLPNPPQPTAAIPTPLPVVDSPIVWYVRGATPPDLPGVNERLNELLAEKNFNARLLIRPVEETQFLQQVSAEPAAWDLVSLAGSQYSYLLEKEMLLPLTRYQAKPYAFAENLLEEQAARLWASLPQSAWDAVRQDGPVYAVPNQAAWAKPRGISIRSDVLRALALQAEMERLQSFSDLTPLLSKIRTGIESGTLKEAGVAQEARWAAGQADLLRPEIAGYDLLAGPLAVSFRDPGAQVVNWYTTPEFLALSEMRREWQQAGYLPNDRPTPDALIEGYRSGKYLVEIGHQVWPGSAEAQAERFGYAWIDKALAPVFLSTGAVRSSVTGINARIAEDPERVRRALLFVELVHTDPEIINLLAYGIEGKHWQWVDRQRGLISLYDESGYRPGYIDQLGDASLLYATSTAQVGQGEALRQWNAAAHASVALGFSFDPRAVPAEHAALRALLPELLEPFANGQVKDIHRAAESLSRALAEAGLEPFQAEMERQLRGWLEQKKVSGESK